MTPKQPPSLHHLRRIRRRGRIERLLAVAIPLCIALVLVCAFAVLFILGAAWALSEVVR